MSRTFTISDERYQQLEKLAVEHGTTPEQLFESWIEDVTRTPAAYETDAWFRHLGMTDEEIEESRRLAKELYGADA